MLKKFIQFISAKPQQGVNVPDFFSDLEKNFEAEAEAKQEAKRVAQILSAKRSLITNLILSAFLFIAHAVIVMLPPSERLFFSILIFKSVKGVLPILTAIANFGTIRFVFGQYLNYCFERFL